MEKDNLMEKIQSLAKRRGFVYQGSEIYGGLAGTWDYGPLGVALKNNIKESWRKKFVSSRNDMYEVDAAILMNSKVWEASGHVNTFSDPLVECTKCKRRYRSDHLIQNQNEFSAIKKVVSDILLDMAKEKFNEFDKTKEKADVVSTTLNNLDVIELTAEQKENMVSVLTPKLRELVNSLSKTNDSIRELIEEVEKADKYIGFVIQYYLNNFVLCPEISCKAHNKWSEPRDFNMMFSTKIGAMEDSAATVYLRPETAQGIFVNFKNIIDSFHPKLPFGIAQIGKAFRNEITPRDFIFRVRELEQMEIEYFVKPEDWEKYFEFFKDEMLEWMEDIGIDMNKVYELEVTKEDLAHYSKRTIDFEFDFPFGKKELFGLAYRTDFDLKNHELEYQDEEAGEKMVPHVIEPSFGVERSVLALLASVYDETDPERVFLKFKPGMAPVICAVSPLLKNKPELVEKAKFVFGMLKAEFGRVMWDDNGNIGKRYRRQDEIGTPWCIVVDFETIEGKEGEKDTVTIRHRDTGAQERVAISDLISKIKEQL